jgi:hypothetical protein
MRELRYIPVIGRPRSLTELEIAPPGERVKLLNEFLARQCRRRVVLWAGIHVGEDLAGGVVRTQ